MLNELALVLGLGVKGLRIYGELIYLAKGVLLASARTEVDLRTFGFK